MSDCWAVPVHPWQRGSGSGSGSTSVSYPRDGTLPFESFRQVKRATVLIDSRDRDYAKYPSSSQYVVFLPETFHNVSSAVLISAELPSTFYVFSAALGTTSLKVVVNSVTQTVTIPDGNYTFATMATALETALAAAFPASTFDVSFNAATSKCTVALVGSPGLTVAVDCTAATKPTGWGLGYYLGFPRGVVTSGTDSVTGTQVANMNPEMYFVVDIEELNNVSQAATYGDGGSNHKVFAKVPICHSSFQYAFYDKTLTCNEIRPPRARLDRLSVSIRFHDGTLVDFHGAEHSLTVELACTLTR